MTPYAWLTGFDGSVDARGVRLDIDLSFGDVLDSSDTVFGLMGALDFEAGWFIAQLNGAYTTATQDATRGFAGPRGGVVSTATIETELSATWLEFMAGARVINHAFGEGHTLALDAFAGLRHTSLGLDLSLRTETDVTLPDGEIIAGSVQREIERDRDWVEHLIGARLGVAFGGGWTTWLRGDVGGFGVDGSDLAWQVMAGLGHEWHSRAGRLVSSAAIERCSRTTARTASSGTCSRTGRCWASRSASCSESCHPPSVCSRKEPGHRLADLDAVAC